MHRSSAEGGENFGTGQEILLQNYFIDMGYFWDIDIKISDSIDVWSIWKYLKTPSCIDIEIYEHIFKNCHL